MTIQPTRGGFGLDEVRTQITGRIYQLKLALSTDLEN